MAVTQRTIAEAKVLEGLPGGKPALKPYKDIAGVWTNGYGNTHGVIPGKIISEAKAEEDLMWHLSGADTALQAALGDVYFALNDNQRGALQLFVLNVGAGAFKGQAAKPSGILRVLKAREFDKVPEQLMRWCKFRDPSTRELKVSPGLQNRRAAEVQLWLEPIDTAGLRAQSVIDDGPAQVVKPEPPPAPATVLQTSTGKATAATLGAGTAAALTQVQPIVEAAKAAGGVNLANLLSLAGVLLIVACVGFTAWTLWDRARKLRENGQ